MIFAIKYYFPSTASWLGGTFKTKKANSLMNFIYNLTNLRLNKLTREKQHQQTLHSVFKKYMPYFRQNSGMTALFFAWNQQQTQSYCTIRLIWCSGQKICPTPTRCKYAGLTKQRWCYYSEGQVPHWCLVNMVNEPLQPRQTNKGDKLAKKETDISVVLIHNKRNNWLWLYLNWHCVLS